MLLIPRRWLGVELIPAPHSSVAVRNQEAPRPSEGARARGINGRGPRGPKRIAQAGAGRRRLCRERPLHLHARRYGSHRRRPRIAGPTKIRRGIRPGAGRRSAKGHAPNGAQIRRPAHESASRNLFGSVIPLTPRHVSHRPRGGQNRSTRCPLQLSTGVGQKAVDSPGKSLTSFASRDRALRRR